MTEQPTLFDLDHPRETRVTAVQADSAEHVHIHPDRGLDGAPTDRIYITNLGHGPIDLVWSQRWDAGGYALRMPVEMARAIASAVQAYTPSEP